MAFNLQVHPAQLRDPGDYSIRARDAQSARDFAIVAIDHEGIHRMQGVITFPEVAFFIAVPLRRFGTVESVRCISCFGKVAPTCG